MVPRSSPSNSMTTEPSFRASGSLALARGPRIFLACCSWSFLLSAMNLRNFSRAACMSAGWASFNACICSRNSASILRSTSCCLSNRLRWNSASFSWFLRMRRCNSCSRFCRSACCCLNSFSRSLRNSFSTRTLLSSSSKRTCSLLISERARSIVVCGSLLFWAISIA